MAFKITNRAEEPLLTAEMIGVVWTKLRRHFRMLFSEPITAMDVSLTMQDPSAHSGGPK